MGYNDDPEAKANLKAAFTGLAIALVFLGIVGGVTFVWAKNATPSHGAAAEHAAPAGTQQH